RALFADFLQNLVQPFCMQAGNVGGFGIGVFSGLEYLCQAFQYVTHGVCSSIAAVDGVRVFQYRLGTDPLAILQGPVKTASPSSMAGNAPLLFHFQQDDIGIAVEADIPEHLLMPGTFALAPEFAPGPGPVHRLTFFNG